MDILTDTDNELTYLLNPLSANPTKWSNTLKQLVGNLPTNCLSVFDHFVGLALKGLKHLCGGARVHFRVYLLCIL